MEKEKNYVAESETSGPEARSETGYIDINGDMEIPDRSQ